MFMINNKKIVAIVSILLLQTFLINSKAQVSDRPLYKNKSFQLYSNRVEQDSFIAKALSRNKIISNYQSPANLYANASISFKFSINGQDNEMGFAIDHHFLCIEKINETPLIVFGRQLKETTSPEPIFLKAKSILKIKLDAREVLRDFNEEGYYVTCTGAKIYKQDFKGFFIAGGASPLTWDFDNLGARNEFKLDDNDGDGIYTIQIILNDPDAAKKTAAVWETQKLYNDFPVYKSSHLISDAIYNMSIEEMVNAIESDSTFRTGKEWAGVWTRDISYSIILSMAYLQPKVAMYSLMKKVNKKKRIIQDTGTGGAYPISTDRVVWATAAWEVYKATGDKDWLRDAYQIIKNSIADDIENAYDSQTGLVKGESSFLDWREQTYPRWMQPADIYQSENLGTNALHYQGNIVLAEMAKLLGNINVYTKHQVIALKIKTGINTYLWLPTKGYYAQYLYGRSFLRTSNRSESLGEALCVLFGIADEAQKKSIISKMPVMDFGVPCIYPQIPNITPYHNNAIWPFVQSYYALAAAAVKNEEAVLESVAAIYRAAGLYVTNKENMVAENGDFAGTQINSSNMLWSLSGNIALIHKIFFGIQFESNSLSFHPFVPKSFSDTRSLNNFKYTVFNYS
jgi:hypothetical protein